MNTICVALVDDHRIVQKALHSYLDAFPDIEIVGTASSGEELLAHVENWLPDVIIMDLMIPGGIDGIETTQRVRAMTPHTEVVALTASNDDARAIAALRAGAIGYVRKDSDPEILLMAVRAAAQGKSVIDPTVAAQVISDLRQTETLADDLTAREQEILKLLAHGYTNREIAEQLVVSDETIKTHVGNILSKFHLAHRLQAVILALKKGIITLDDIDL